MNRGRMSPPLRSSHGISHAVSTVLAELRALGSEKNRAGMARFGINTERAFGVSMAALRPLERRYRRRLPLPPISGRAAPRSGDLRLFLVDHDVGERERGRVLDLLHREGGRNVGDLDLGDEALVEVVVRLDVGNDHA